MRTPCFIIFVTLALGCAPPELACDPADPVGESGGAGGGELTVCVRGADGLPLAGAVVESGAESATTDTTGRAVIGIADHADVEVRADGFVTRAFLGASHERLTVVMAARAGASVTVSGAIGGLAALPGPVAGTHRVVEVRPSSTLDPASLAGALEQDPVEVCVGQDADCTFQLSAPSAAARLSVTVSDVDDTSGARTTVALAVAPIDGGNAQLTMTADPMLTTVGLTGVGVDAVVGVPGVGQDGQALFFAPDPGLSELPLPSASGRPWIALAYTPTDALPLRVAILQGPGATVAAPAAPAASWTGDAISLPEDGAVTLSELDGEEEMRRTTVLDGRASVAAPLATSRVVVVRHGESTTFQADGTITEIEGVLALARP